MDEMSNLTNTVSSPEAAFLSSQEDFLLQSLLDQVSSPAMLLRPGESPILLNRRCELLLGFNGRQLTYLQKIGQFTLRRWGRSRDADEWRLAISGIAERFRARRVAPPGGHGDWSLLLLSLPEVSEEEKSALPFAALVGKSKAFFDTVDACRRAELPGQPVLLRGESGTGKEALARAMHLEGPFPHGNFICIHNNTEFTEFEQAQEADPARIGSILRGHTFYVDEVANFNHYNQDRLFFLTRRSQDGDFKIICSTSADLATLLARGEWHRNLHEVLSSGRIDVPPLRQRRDDILPLALHYLAEINRRAGRRLRLEPEVQAQLQRYDWPGNLYELESFLIRAVREADAVDGAITLQALETSLRIRAGRGAESEYSLRLSEKELILRALNDFSTEDRAKEAAARALGISVATLYRKLNEYGIRIHSRYDV